MAIARHAVQFKAFLLCIYLCLLAGCVVSQPRDVKSLQETRGEIFRGYDGPPLPEEETVWVDWGYVTWPFKFGSGIVVSIDGVQINPTHQERLYALSERQELAVITSAAELLPGMHVFKYECTAHQGLTRSFQLKTNLEAGHLYRIDCDAARSAKSELLFATELIDINSGELLAGRPQEALDWSWHEFQLVLQGLKKDKAGKQKILEMFLNPAWPSANNPHYDLNKVASGILDASNTIIYRLYPQMTGVLMDNSGVMEGYFRKPLPFSKRQRGLLFMKFDEASLLSSYQYVDIPNEECLSSEAPANWYAPAERFEYVTCNSLVLALTVAEYLANDGSGSDAYLAVERGLLINTNLINGRLEVGVEQHLLGTYDEAILPKTISEASVKAQSSMYKRVKQFFDLYPASLEAAAKLFTEESMIKFQQVAGRDFELLLLKKLLIYGEFASPQAYTDAQIRAQLFLDNKHH